MSVQNPREINDFRAVRVQFVVDEQEYFNERDISNAPF